MTDRISHFTVILDDNLREDDVEPVLIALRMVKGVLSVQPHVADGMSAVAEMRARNEIEKRLYRALRD